MAHTAATVEGEDVDSSLQGENDNAARQTYAGAGAATLALFGGLAGVLIGWIIGAQPRSIPGQGTLAGADILATTLVAGLFGVGLGALVGALWGMSIKIAPQESLDVREVASEQVPYHPGERVVPLEAYRPSITDHRSLTPGLQEPALLEPGPLVATSAASEDQLMPPAQSANPPRDVVEVPRDDDRVATAIDTITYTTVDTMAATPTQNRSEEVAMDDVDGRKLGQDPNSITGTKGAIDPETGAYGTAGTPVTTGYGVSGSTIGTGSSQVRDEHEAGDFAGSTPDSASYEMGGRGSDDTPTTSGSDDSSDTPVTEKYQGSMADQAPAQSDPDTKDIYEASPAYGPGAEQKAASIPSVETSHNSDASLDSPPTSSATNSEEVDASAGTNIAGTSDPRGLGDNTDDGVRG